MLLPSRLVAHSLRKRGNRQTDKRPQTKYCNPRCACAPRVNKSLQLRHDHDFTLTPLLLADGSTRPYATDHKLLLGLLRENKTVFPQVSASIGHFFLSWMKCSKERAEKGHIQINEHLFSQSLVQQLHNSIINNWNFASRTSTTLATLHSSWVLTSAYST